MQLYIEIVTGLPSRAMAEAGHLEAVVERCVARCSNDRGELLSVLRGVQGELGCLRAMR